MPGFARVLEFDLALEEAGRDSESLPEAFARELLESPEEWVEAPELLELDAPCLLPVVLVPGRARWPELDLAPWPEWVSELEPARWLAPLVALEPVRWLALLVALEPAGCPELVAELEPVW